MLYWRDGAIRNQWLQIKVLANARTRLTAPDVFYFGNLVAETGNGSIGAAPGTAAVTVHDAVRTRAALGRRAAGITSSFDFNRDGRVDVRDYALVLATLRRRSVLQLLTAPA